jgi:hypothetical protein
VADPEISPVSFRFATLPLDPATAGRVQHDVKALREHFRRLSAKAQIQRHHAPVNVLGGYRFPDAPNIDLSPFATAQPPAPTARAVVGDGLDIPGFLLRSPAASKAA